MEEKIVNSQENQGTRGQWFGFIIAIVFLAASVLLTLKGYEIAGIGLGGTTIVGLVAVFVTGKIFQFKDLQRKMDSFPNHE